MKNLLKKFIKKKKSSEKISKIGVSRESLLLLEKKGKYVFHGSADKIKVLKPRQSYNVNTKTGRMEKDGLPAVFATQYAEIAIFRALININNVAEKAECFFGIDGRGLYFAATKNLLDAAKKIVGKVYVLDKRKFKKNESMQCRSHESITPIKVIEVTATDLPKDIQILKNKEQ